MCPPGPLKDFIQETIFISLTMWDTLRGTTCLRFKHAAFVNRRCSAFRAERAEALSAAKASIVDGDLSARGPTVQT